MEDFSCWSTIKNTVILAPLWPEIRHQLPRILRCSSEIPYCQKSVSLFHSLVYLYSQIRLAIATAFFSITSNCQRFHHSTGGLSIAVPGEMKGYWTAYRKFGGQISWREILLPTIKLCEEGIPINRHVAARLQQKEAFIRSDKDLRQVRKNERIKSKLRGSTFIE